MKKLGLVIVLAFATITLKAQNSEFMNFYNKYAGNEAFTIVSVNERMLQLFSNFDTDDEDAEAVKNALEGLKGIKLIANN